MGRGARDFLTDEEMQNKPQVTKELLARVFSWLKPYYKQMPTAQSAQQILKLLEKDWKSFFTTIKDWSKNKDKYLGRPKLPKYKSKNGKHILVLTNQEARLKEDILVFPKVFAGFVLRPQFTNKDNFVSFHIMH